MRIAHLPGMSTSIYTVLPIGSNHHPLRDLGHVCVVEKRVGTCDEKKFGLFSGALGCIRSSLRAVKTEISRNGGIKMRRSKLVLGCLLFLAAITPLVWSQSQTTTQPPIPGYLDPTTHMFSTRAATAAAVTPAVALTTIIARYILTFNPQINDGGSMSCSAYIYTNDAAGTSLEEYAGDTGSSTSCTVTILFQWSLATPGSSSIFIEPSVGTSGGANASRSTELAQITEPVPANGQTITIPINAPTGQGIVF